MTSTLSRLSRFFAFRRFTLSVFFALCGLSAVSSLAGTFPPHTFLPPEAEGDPDRVVTTSEELSLKATAEPVTLVTDAGPKPDVTFRISVPKKGLYQIQTLVFVKPEGREKILAARTKWDGLTALVRINEGFVTSRFLAAPPCHNFEAARSVLGIFSLPAGESAIQLWLPQGAALKSLTIQEAKLPSPPEAAQTYQPALVPPASHPRLWVSAEKLPEFRKGLSLAENAEVWGFVRKESEKAWPSTLPGLPAPKPATSGSASSDSAVSSTSTGTSQMAAAFSPAFLRQVKVKSFTALMTEDETLARSVAEHFIPYLERLDFGNVLDVTRDVGETMHAAALTYDWLFPWLTEDEKKLLEVRMLELAVHLECSYPPFGRNVFVGHGNESMILRDTLSVGIALFDRNPEPYRYCAWLILEQLVPVRAFQYQSQRHNQGVSYGFYRSQWEFQAAFLLKAFSGKLVFDRNLLSLRDFLIQMRLPSGEFFPDGDGQSRLPNGDAADVALMISALGNDPLMKGEFLRSFWKAPIRTDPVFFLLVNDPNLKPAFSYAQELLAFESGETLQSLILRTGWMADDWFRRDLDPNSGFDPNSLESVTELRGGVQHSLNHQHLDAGSFQIWYRGWQTVDLGLYYFYGTPYDLNFHKKSGAHNCLFVFDPSESKATAGAFNDGGQRALPSPKQFEDYFAVPVRKTGKVLQSRIEPDASHPLQALWQVDLTPAYAEKVERCVRTFCWLNLKREDVPTALIVLDEVTVKDPNYQKWCQINTVNPPQLTENGFVSVGALPKGATIEPGRLSLTTLLPIAENRKITTRCLTDLPTEIQPTYANRCANHPFAKGWQTWISTQKPAKTDRFLNVMQVLAPNAEPLSVRFEEMEGTLTVHLGDRTVRIPCALKTEP